MHHQNLSSHGHIILLNILLFTTYAAFKRQLFFPALNPTLKYIMPVHQEASTMKGVGGDTSPKRRFWSPAQCSAVRTRTQSGAAAQTLVSPFTPHASWELGGRSAPPRPPEIKPACHLQWHTGATGDQAITADKPQLARALWIPRHQPGPPIPLEVLRSTRGLRPRPAHLNPSPRWGPTPPPRERPARGGRGQESLHTNPDTRGGTNTPGHHPPRSPAPPAAGPTPARHPRPRRSASSPGACAVLSYSPPPTAHTRWGEAVQVKQLPLSGVHCACVNPLLAGRASALRLRVPACGGRGRTAAGAGPERARLPGWWEYNMAAWGPGREALGGREGTRPLSRSPQDPKASAGWTVRGHGGEQRPLLGVQAAGRGPFLRCLWGGRRPWLEGSGSWAGSARAEVAVGAFVVPGNRRHCCQLLDVPAEPAHGSAGLCMPGSSPRGAQKSSSQSCEAVTWLSSDLSEGFLRSC